MGRRWRWGVMGAAGLSILAWWGLRGEPGAGSREVRPGQQASRAVRAAAALREEPVPPRQANGQEATPPAPSEGALDALYDALEPGSGRVRCAVGGLVEDGVFTARPDRAAHLLVRGGVLTATVTEAVGEVHLEADWAPVARLRWWGAESGRWGGCTVTDIERVEVRGTLRDADGDPVVDHEVRGCFPGDVARTDEAGAWVLTGAAGTTCHPMAFVDADDGRFGKSNVVNVEIEAPGPVRGVALVLPPDGALWSVEQQRAMAGTLAAMSDELLAREAEQVARIRRAASASDPAVGSAVEALTAHGAGVLERMEDHISRLDDPEEQLHALRDGWLNLH